MSGAASLISVLWASVALAGSVPYLVDADASSVTACRRSPRMECRTFGPEMGGEVRYGFDGSTESWRTRLLPGPSEPLRFAVVGDLGTGSPAQAAVAALLEETDPQFALLLGDIVYPGGAPADYETKYFPIYGRLLSRVPFFPSVGNHDYGNFKRSAAKGEARFKEGYGEVFRRPPYYSFRAGDAEFFSVDTNREGYDIAAAAPIATDGEQWRWLKRGIESSAAKWRFVFLHVPLYSSSFHGDHAALRSFLKPLFDGKVDVVFQGHDHVYERRRPIDGVLYVTAGTGGAKLKRIFLPDDTVAESDREHGLVLATLDGGKLRLEFRDIEGEVEDAVELEKRPD